MTEPNIISRERIEGAFGALFSGRGARDDALIVLGALKEITGFYMVTGADAPDHARAFNDGGRRIYASLLSMIAKDSAAVAVEREARQTALNQPKGTK